METMGPCSCSAPREPKKGAALGEHATVGGGQPVPLSAAVDAGSAAMATITELSGAAGVLTVWASPNPSTPPPW